MKLAIVGSRNLTDYRKLTDAVWKNFKLKELELIISGGAQGADTLAEEFAERLEIPFKKFPADWKKYGKPAGYIRNEQIVAEADVVLAFPGRISKGTRHTIKIAQNANKRVLVIKCPEVE